MVGHCPGRGGPARVHAHQEPPHGRWVHVVISEAAKNRLFSEITFYLNGNFHCKSTAAKKKSVNTF